MSLQLVFATNNRHKLEEVAAKIDGNIQLLTLNDIGCTGDIAETGSTFKENASIKSHNRGRVVSSFPLNLSNVANPMMAMKSVPSPAMM